MGAIVNQDTVLGIVRHLLTAGGGILVASGYTTNDQWTAISGGVVALVGVIWSILQKKQAASKLADAQASPAQVGVSTK